MTTAVTRPRTVTARINTTADNTPATPAKYTATLYMNTAPHSFDGYQHHHPLAEATLPDGSPLHLVFHASSRVRDHDTAADAAFTVGNDQGPDDNGQTWPTDIRSVSVGDIVKVTGPDHRIVHLSVDSCGFTAVPEPTNLVDLTGTRATSRRHTDQPVPTYSIAQATEEALKYLGDQWGAARGPWGTTGHLRAWDHRTPFTVGVTATGALFLRNNHLGDAKTLDVTATDPLGTVAQAIADAVGGLY